MDPSFHAQDLLRRLVHPSCPTLMQASSQEIFSSVPAQPTSIHRARDEGGGDRGEMNLKVWPERCSVHTVR